LILKRNEGGIIVVLPALSTEAVEFLLPYLVALLVVGLHGRTEVVGHDGETLTVGNYFQIPIYPSAIL